MPPLLLARHPSCSCEAIRRFEVNVHHGREELSLEYSIEGDIAGLCIPESSPPRRVDGLWKNTCFEVFLKETPEATEYFEFNFAASTEWAIYRFDAYREGLAVVEECLPPRITVRQSANRLALNAVIDLNGLSMRHETSDPRLALSSVVKDKHGGMSYWALAHPKGKPDFHHRDSFAFRLAPADAS